MRSIVIRSILQSPLFRVALQTSAMALIGFALASHTLSAQATYQYTGNPFTFFSCGPSSPGPGTLDCPNDPAPGNTLTSYTATDHVSATLSFNTPLPANLSYQDVSTLSGFLLSMTDGHQNLSTATHPAGIIAKVSTDGGGNIIGPWLLVINVGNAADSGISSENEPPVLPFVQDQGTLACCDPTVTGDIALNQHAAGIWGSGAPTPSQQVATLITAITQMSVPKLGTSLIDKLNQVLTDISSQNGLACSDLSAFLNQVKAQTGKSITAAQATQILGAVSSIQSALQCGA